MGVVEPTGLAVPVLVLETAALTTIGAAAQPTTAELDAIRSSVVVLVDRLF